MTKKQPVTTVKGLEIDTFRRESDFLLYTTPDGKIRVEIFIKNENIDEVVNEILNIIKW